MSKRRFLQVLASLSALLAGACMGCAQIGSKTAPADQIRAHARMTVEDVVRLAKAGVSDEIILAQIQGKHQSFDLTVDQLIELKSASVSERVIRAMIDISAPPTAPAPLAQPAAAASGTAKRPDKQPAPPVPGNVTA